MFGMKVFCANCDARFHRSPSQVKKANYCSQVCWKQAHERECGWCGITFKPKNHKSETHGRFCSQTCWRKKVHSENPRTAQVACGHCEKEFTTYQSGIKRGQGKYCSKTCVNSSRTLGQSSNWRGKGWKTIRRAIRERDEVCVRCGEADKNRRLSVDHIIPWRYLSENPKVANHPDNLAALCVSCHGIKTVAIERPLAKGDFAPLHKFYGDRAERAIALAKQYGLKL